MYKENYNVGSDRLYSLYQTEKRKGKKSLFVQLTI